MRTEELLRGPDQQQEEESDELEDPAPRDRAEHRGDVDADDAEEGIALPALLDKSAHEQERKDDQLEGGEEARVAGGALRTTALKLRAAEQRDVVTRERGGRADPDQHGANREYHDDPLEVRPGEQDREREHVDEADGQESQEEDRPAQVRLQRPLASAQVA